MATAKKSALGRGLSALMPDKPLFVEEDLADSDKIVMLPIDRIHPDPQQPRHRFDEEKLAELALSIKQFGVMQPLIVKRQEEDYQIIVGERRYRAAQQAGLNELPCLIRSFSDSEQAEISLIENIQRENLSPMEEASAYRRLMDDYGYTQEQLAQRLGKSRPHIANTLRLLRLPPQYRLLVDEGRLSPGHARAVLSLEDTRTQTRLVDAICQRNLSVRQAEQLARQLAEAKEKPQRSSGISSAQLHELERRFTEVLGMPAHLQGSLRKGRLVISYADADALQSLIEKLLPPR